MPKKNGNISLSSYDDIFQTDQSREEAQQERVQEIPLNSIHLKDTRSRYWTMMPCRKLWRASHSLGL